MSLILLLLPIHAASQNKYIPDDPYTHWNGVSHWSRYQITSPGYLGPNALPVPLLHKADIPESVDCTWWGEYYYGKGDETYDVKTRLIIPVAQGRIGLEFMYVPVEFYQMDSLVSRTRRTKSGKSVDGLSWGDVYFGTMIRVIKDHPGLPDLTLAMSCKTASGTDQSNARYTNSPAYYFDASIGDTYGKDRGFFQHMRWYAEIGFYCWQTYLDNYPQDDALLFGAGVDFDFKDFFIDQSIGGYSGYMNNGDQPLVYRVDLGLKMKKSAIVFGYEQGICDFPFQSIRAGLEFSMLKSKKK